MKYLKTYEYKRTEPCINDYVICNISYKNANNDYADKISNFINNNIGKILEIDYIYGPNFYHVYYQNVPKEITGAFGWKQKFDFSDDYMNFNQTQIIYHSTSKEDLEPYINAIKYNL